MSEPVDPHSPDSSAASEEEQAWARVLASWADEAAHRAYLARFTDLEGYAVAGGRYRAVLRERPQDPMALRMRDELVKKATILGLSSLPRARPSQVAKLPRWARLLLWSAVASAGAYAVGLIASLVRSWLGAGP